MDIEWTESQSIHPRGYTDYHPQSPPEHIPGYLGIVAEELARAQPHICYPTHVTLGTTPTSLPPRPPALPVHRRQGSERSPHPYSKLSLPLHQNRG
jgi:hypothetical protein